MGCLQNGFKLQIEEKTKDVDFGNRDATVLPMNLTWERWRLAGVFLISPQQLTGETPALPGSWSRCGSNVGGGGSP